MCFSLEKYLFVFLPSCSKPWRTETRSYANICNSHRPHLINIQYMSARLNYQNEWLLWNLATISNVPFGCLQGNKDKSNSIFRSKSKRENTFFFSQNISVKKYTFWITIPVTATILMRDLGSGKGGAASSSSVFSRILREKNSKYHS